MTDVFQQLIVTLSIRDAQVSVLGLRDVPLLMV